MDVKSFVRGLPKAELHLHLEGSLEPEMLMCLADRNKVGIPFRSVEEIRAAYRFTELQDFLDVYYQGMNVLREEEDFHDLTMAYLERAAADGAVHVEVFYDPQGHTARGRPLPHRHRRHPGRAGRGARTARASPRCSSSASCATCPRTRASPPSARPSPTSPTGGSPASASIRPRRTIRPASSGASSPRPARPASSWSPMPARKARPPTSPTRWIS